MVYRWEKATKENFYCCITEGWGKLAVTNHWNGPARNSTTFEKKPNSIISIPNMEEFPLVMQPNINKALEIYNTLAGSAERIVLNPAQLSCYLR
jgi:hypothetical protein